VSAVVKKKIIRRQNNHATNLSISRSPPD